MSLFFTWILFAIANFSYQWAVHHDLTLAARDTWFQGGALLCAGLWQRGDAGRRAGR